MVRRQRARGQETRAKIIQSATTRFADRGFAATRLEDIASDVGFQRAALFYYFRDKAELYEEVLEEVWRTVLSRVQAAHDAGATISERLELGAMAMVDALVERPSIARILLREASSAHDEAYPFAGAGRPMIDQLASDLAEGVRSGELNPVSTDPFQLASVMSMSIFYVAAVPRLHADVPYDPLAPDAVAEHKELVRNVLRVAMGTRSPN